MTEGERTEVEESYGSGKLLNKLFLRRGGGGGGDKLPEEVSMAEI